MCCSFQYWVSAIAVWGPAGHARAFDLGDHRSHHRIEL
jgi:hypothetical protein